MAYFRDLSKPQKSRFAHRDLNKRDPTRGLYFDPQQLTELPGCTRQLLRLPLVAR